MAKALIPALQHSWPTFSGKPHLTSFVVRGQWPYGHSAINGYFVHLWPYGYIAMCYRSRHVGYPWKSKCWSKGWWCFWQGEVSDWRQPWRLHFCISLNPTSAKPSVFCNSNMIIIMTTTTITIMMVGRKVLNWPPNLATSGRHTQNQFCISTTEPLVEGAIDISSSWGCH